MLLKDQRITASKRQANPTIVVVAYNRPRSLERLLVSVAQADYQCCEQQIRLVISIDWSEDKSVAKVAENFHWQNGEKKVIVHEKNLGLRQHILYCGDLTEEYSSIILLEDDIYTSPQFYIYAMQVGSFYANDRSIAGISLYNQKINETTRRPFKAIDDGSDGYFLQLAASWGEMWTKEQWREFSLWMQGEMIGNSNSVYLPKNVTAWPERSWKKLYNRYMVEKNKYFVYPRFSLTTNFGEVGANLRESSNLHQSELLMGRRDFVFKKIDDSLAIYDAHMEILPKCLVAYNQNLSAYDFETDLYGSKNMAEVKRKYILTTRHASRSIMSFALDLHPLDANVALNLDGNKIKLCEKKAVKISKYDEFRRIIDEYNYDIPFFSYKKGLFYIIYKAIKKITRKLKLFLK